MIYVRHGLRERLSIVCRLDESSLMAVNLYRHDDLPEFSDTEIDQISSASSLIAAMVRRHLELDPRVPMRSSAFAVLTKREREVCDRMLKGWTYEGIGVDLKISPGTVKTYRDRAFDRLGIHHRNELFALMSGQLL
jgi:DNA-binding NarL/FixJ family response regulator